MGEIAAMALALNSASRVAQVRSEFSVHTRTQDEVRYGQKNVRWLIDPTVLATNMQILFQDEISPRTLERRIYVFRWIAHLINLKLGLDLASGAGVCAERLHLRTQTRVFNPGKLRYELTFLEEIVDESEIPEPMPKQVYRFSVVLESNVGPAA